MVRSGLSEVLAKRAQKKLSPRMMARAQQLAALREELPHMVLSENFGTVEDVQGPLARVLGPDFKVGDMCQLMVPGAKELLGEVIGVKGNHCIITPLGTIDGIGQGTRVRKRGTTFTFPFSELLKGRMVSGLGQLIGPPLNEYETRPQPVRCPPPDPMERTIIDKPLYTGLRVIDGLMTMARGQRIAIIGPPGAGKSTLLAAIAANVDVDVVVFGLIGERGREITDFVTHKLSQETRDKLVVVAAPADKPALERLYAANTATAIAEGYRDQGKSVLLVLDSLTRVARAMREVGLAAGEPPTRRGYPASVFAQLPELLERPGPTQKGEITAIYSVLSEGDASNDPIAEETRSLVDGHIILDSKVFAEGRFPAINVTQSLSRLMPDVVDQGHMALNTEFRKILAKYQEIELLVQIGEYKHGQDEDADRALKLYPYVIKFLKQSDMSFHQRDDMIAWMSEVAG